MRYLITGASGFIGSSFIKFLAQEKPGAQIFGVSSSGPPQESCDYRQLDLLDKKKTAELVEEISPDLIFHLAGKSDGGLQELMESNADTAISVLEAASSIKARTFVIGSAAEYGRPASLPVHENAELHPESAYGISMACRTIISAGFASRGEVAVGRLFNPLGRGLGQRFAAASFASQIREIKAGKQKTILVGNLAIKRDWIDIEDACRAFLAIAEKGESGQVYNVCSGRSESLEKVLMLMLDGMEAEVKVDPSKISSTEVPEIYGSIEKITHDTGWKPEISLEESVTKMLS